MATRREIRSDIILRVTKGKPSDDFEIDDRQIDFWIDMIRAAIVSARIKEESDSGLQSYLTFLECLDISEASSACLDADICASKRYEVNLPADVINLDEDIGVYRVETAAGYPIRKIRPSDKSRFKNLKFVTFNAKNLGYYRVENKIVLLGGTTNFLENGKVNIYAILSTTVGTVGDDDEFPIAEDLLPALIQECEAIARRELELPEDISNDAQQE